MKRLVFLAFIIFLASFTAYSQDRCPEGMVCISADAARAALEAGDKAKALETENAVLKQAVRDAQDNTQKMAIEFARVSGENTILKQQQIRDAALVDLALKQTRKKRNGFINIF